MQHAILGDPRIQNNLFCGIANISTAVLQFAAQQHKAGQAGQSGSVIPINDPFFVEVLDMMPIVNAEGNDDDVEIDADDEADFDNE